MAQLDVVMSLDTLSNQMVSRHQTRVVALVAMRCGMSLHPDILEFAKKNDRFSIKL